MKPPSARTLKRMRRDPYLLSATPRGSVKAAAPCSGLQNEPKLANEPTQTERQLQRSSSWPGCSDARTAITRGAEAMRADQTKPAAEAVRKAGRATHSKEAP